MDQLDYTTTDETNHQKGRHLTLDERGIIVYLHNQGKSYQVIADAIGCAKSTVFYEIRRGTPERKSNIAVKIPGKTKDAVADAMETLREEYGDRFNSVFKTITADNGREFARLPEPEDRGTQVYYAHPYASCERGQNERRNRLLRRYIPKGTPVDNDSAEDILFAADCINLLPRKTLNYDTPESLFNNELDLIYAM